jgi:hypothetical protein
MNLSEKVRHEGKEGNSCGKEKGPDKEKDSGKERETDKIYRSGYKNSSG